MSILFDLLADFWGDIADWLIERVTGKQRRRPQKSSPSKIEQIRKPGIHAYWCGCRVFIFLFFKVLWQFFINIYLTISFYNIFMYKLINKLCFTFKFM